MRRIVYIVFIALCLIELVSIGMCQPFIAAPSRQAIRIGSDNSLGYPPLFQPAVPFQIFPLTPFRCYIPPVGAGPNLTQKVEPGVPPPIAASVVFQGNTLISNSDLQRAVGIKNGQQLTQDDIVKAVNNIQNAYEDRGRLATVTDVSVPASGQSGPVTFKIEEVKITDVQMAGVQKTRPNAILRILEVKPGQLYNREAVIRDYGRLQQLGIFDELTWDLQASGPSCATLVWYVRERSQLNYASVGGSYGPVGGVVGTGNLILGNLRGRGERLSLIGSLSSVDGRPGGEAEYFWPYISRDTSALVDLYSNPRYLFSRPIISDEDNYYERRSGFRGNISKHIQPTVITEYGLRAESVSVNNLPVDLFTTQTEQNGSLFLPHVRAIWDNRNSVMNPTRGSYTAGFLEGGIFDRSGGGTIGIAKSWIDQRWFLPLRKPQAPNACSPEIVVPVLATRLAAGSTIGSVPFYEQFFIGGIEELPLRGYIGDRFWGRYLLLVNTEMRYPLLRNLLGVVFVDAGDTWNSAYQFLPSAQSETEGFKQHTKFSPRVGAGLGLRYASPAGPLRLDVAYGDAVRVYFSVGHTF